MVFDLVVLPLWLLMWSVLSYFYMSPHCDLSSHNLCNICQSSLILLYVFASATCLVLYGIKSALFASVVIMFFSHNIVASLHVVVLIVSSL
jgi:hypothetical protein